MLDGRKLAVRIEALLDVVGNYQRKGKVNDFWAYFGAAVDRYVGANAEEIQAEAMRAGVHVSQLLTAFGVHRRPGGEIQPEKVAPLPELIAQRADEVTKAKEATLREKLARKRAQQAACKADAQQPTLPL